MPNQVINGDLSGGNTGWTLTGNVTVHPFRDLLSFSAGETTPNGVASQTVNVVDGASYDFSFEYGRLGGLGTSGIYSVTYVDGMGVTQTLSTGAFANGTGGGVADTPYPTQNIVIPAGVTEVTITFTDTTADGSSKDLYIDDVVLDGPTPGVPCFCRGTLIETDQGPVPVEDLRGGDLVCTLDHGLQPVRWIGSYAHSARDVAAHPNLRPIRIAAGALGNGLPVRELYVSRQHRVLVQSKIAERMFRTDEVLVAAIKLVPLSGIDFCDDAAEVEYFHVLCDRHEVLVVEGAPLESLLAGPEALKALIPAARFEIDALFPGTLDGSSVPEPARTIPSGPKAKRLILRHYKNSRSICRQPSQARDWIWVNKPDMSDLAKDGDTPYLTHVFVPNTHRSPAKTLIKAPHQRRIKPCVSRVLPLHRLGDGAIRMR